MNPLVLATVPPFVTFIVPVPNSPTLSEPLRLNVPPTLSVPLAPAARPIEAFAPDRLVSVMFRIATSPAFSPTTIETSGLRTERLGGDWKGTSV